MYLVMCAVDLYARRKGNSLESFYNFYNVSISDVPDAPTCQLRTDVNGRDCGNCKPVAATIAPTEETCDLLRIVLQSLHLTISILYNGAVIANNVGLSNSSCN